MPDSSQILVVHAAATWGMAGVIWFVQWVHYPAYREVGATEFAAYQAGHPGRTGWVVAPLMLTEAASAAWLLWSPPTAIAPIWLWLGLFLIAVSWASTAFLQIPLHLRLTAGLDGPTIERLIRTNWIRTTAWTLRAGLVTAWLFTAVQR
jgi:hypothetical protein